MFRLIILITFATLFNMHSYAANETDAFIKAEAQNLVAVVGKSSKVDAKAIDAYIKKNLEASSDEYVKVIVNKLNKTSVNSRPLLMAQLLYSEKKYLKRGEACYSATNQCHKGLICGLPLYSKDKNYYEKCLVAKKANQACSPETDMCEAGSCKKMRRLTNINTCSIEKDSCSKDSECCSNSCDKRRKICRANYKCSSCFGMGQRPDKGGECCESLFKNSNGVCAPILPTFSSLLELIIPSAHAYTRAGDSSEIEAKVTALKSKLEGQLSDNQVSSSRVATYMSSIENNYSSCSSKQVRVYDNDGPTRYPRKACFEELYAGISTEYSHQQAVGSKMNEATKLIDNFRKETLANPKHPQNSDDAFNKFAAPYRNAITSCANKGAPLGTDHSTRLRLVKQCVDNAKITINDGVVEANYISMMTGKETTDPDYTLYNGHQDASPLFEDVYISDMKSCRVNLFGDFLSAQSNDYFEVMMMMYAMDYTTGGKDEGDFFHIKSQYNTYKAASGSYTGTDNQPYNWNVQTNSMRGFNFSRFDPSIVGRGRPLWDEFDYSVGEEALKEITNYIEDLPKNEKKIFLHLFYNGKLSHKDRNSIVNYYMKDDDKFLEGFDGHDPKSGAGRYNIRDVVRFEAIKYKHSQFKLYSVLKKRSLEMMCRCVDTVGPMSPEDWLQPDVEANYIANCNGLGKYDTYVLNNEKEVCDETGGNCKKVSDKDYMKTITDKEKQEVESLGGESAIEKNSLGNAVVKNDGYSLKDREQDYFVQTLDQVTACIGSGECTKSSRYAEFVQDGKVKFTDARKETAKGHGMDFTLFLRDMALMKIKAIEDATLQNISAGTALFEYTVQWLKEYNWNYIKYNGKRYTLGKKCLYPVCWIMKLMKFFGLHKNSLIGNLVNITTGGILFGSDYDVDLDPERGPENICGPRTSSTWKISRIPVGRKYKIKCMSFHSQNNDVCNKELAAGACTRNTYAKKEGSVALKLLDPFLPDMSSLYSTNYSSRTKIPFNAGKHDIHNYYIFNDRITNFYRDHARGYFLSTLVSEDNGDEKETEDRKRMADEFAQYAYRYHFYAPKVSRLDYYITPGLIPYFEMLIAKLNNFMGQTLANLSGTAAYALKMHNFYHTVNDGINASTNVERKQTHRGIPDVQLSNGFGQFTNWLSGFSTAGSNFQDALNGKKTLDSTVSGKLETGGNSTNSAISRLSKGIRKQLDRNAKRRTDTQLMKDTLAKRGKSGEFASLQRIADKRSAEHSANLSSLTDSFLNSTLGSSAASRIRSRMANGGQNGDGSLSGEGYSQGEINPDALSASSKKGRGGNGIGDGSGGDGLNGRAGADGLGADGAIPAISFDNLDDTDGLFDMDDGAMVMLGDQKMTAGQLKNYISNIKDKRARQNLFQKQDKEWERDGVTLFELISQRYQQTAFPKMLK
ncbi:hypothetical protein ACRXCV_09230 [Halobacteriovorax sp. GFR7]|uniref:hypothetical protein n=1 Tax=unclassified Halobacteriovorax TaxID=2639665 RepID=UPI003D9613CD